MRKITLVAALITGTALVACTKTGEGEYEVERPVVGTTTDTVLTPTVDVGTKEDTVVVKTPTVDVRTPEERRRDTTPNQ
ncbi:MAG: hypothetical protein M3373_01910 [Gemmatimonadota bacterium]|nr:hypothetical protein [Gemmatimonadota bacterium]